MKAKMMMSAILSLCVVFSVMADKRDNRRNDSQERRDEYHQQRSDRRYNQEYESHRQQNEHQFDREKFVFQKDRDANQR